VAQGSRALYSSLGRTYREAAFGALVGVHLGGHVLLRRLVDTVVGQVHAHRVQVVRPRLLVSAFKDPRPIVRPPLVSVTVAPSACRQSGVGY